MSKYKKIADLLENMKIPKGNWEKDIYNQKGVVEPIDINFLKKVQGNELGKTNIDDLMKSIESEGLNEPVILGFDPKTNNIRLGEGNHRVEALNKLGYTNVPTRMYRSGIDDNIPGALKIKFKPSSDAIDPTYYPADMKPSELLDLEQILQNYRKSKE